MGRAVLHVWTQNYKNVGTCPGLPLQLLALNHFFQSDRTNNLPPPPFTAEQYFAFGKKFLIAITPL